MADETYYAEHYRPTSKDNKKDYLEVRPIFILVFKCPDQKVSGYYMDN